MIALLDLAMGLHCVIPQKECSMPLINIVIGLVVIGVVLYLINRFIPMASSIKSILNIVVVVAVCLWLLRVTGLLGDLSAIRIGN